MRALTASERRGATVVVLLLVIGTGHDLWRAHRPRLAPDPEALGGEFAGSPRSPGRTIEGEIHPRAHEVDPRAAVPERASSGGELIDLNRASTRDLDRLPGIGPVLAGRIVEQRETHGPYREIDDLLAVRGIGPRLLDRIRSQLVLADSTAGRSRKSPQRNRASSGP